MLPLSYSWIIEYRGGRRLAQLDARGQELGGSAIDARLGIPAFLVGARRVILVPARPLPPPFAQIFVEDVPNGDVAVLFRRNHVTESGVHVRTYVLGRRREVDGVWHSRLQLIAPPLDGPFFEMDEHGQLHPCAGFPGAIETVEDFRGLDYSAIADPAGRWLLQSK